MEKNVRDLMFEVDSTLLIRKFYGLKQIKILEKHLINTTVTEKKYGKKGIVGKIMWSDINRGIMIRLDYRGKVNRFDWVHASDVLISDSVAIKNITKELIELKEAEGSR